MLQAVEAGASPVRFFLPRKCHRDGIADEADLAVPQAGLVQRGADALLQVVAVLLHEGGEVDAAQQVDAAAQVEAEADLLVRQDAALVRHPRRLLAGEPQRSEEHTSELQSLMRISYDVFCLKNKHINN